MNLLILDTEQTYGDIGYVIYSTSQKTLIERQLVIDEVNAAAKINAGFKQKMAAYEKLPSNIYQRLSLEQCLRLIQNDIEQYRVKCLIAHNLSADRKVFNSWCVASGLGHLNPFSIINNEFDSCELVKFLTINNTSYSLEGFVREFCDGDFVQEHTGLADARLIAQIFDALEEKEIEFFLSNEYEFCKEYEKRTKTIETLLSRKMSTAQLAQKLYNMGYCEKVSMSKDGKPLAKPNYILNGRGVSFFNKCDLFISKKHDMRGRYQRKMVVNSIQKETQINDTAAQEVYNIESDRGYYMVESAKQEAQNIIGEAQAQAKLTLDARTLELHLKGLKEEIEKRKREIINLDNTLSNMESCRAAAEQKLKDAEQTRNNMIKRAAEESKRRMQMGESIKDDIIKNAKTEAHNIIDKANLQQKEIIKQAQVKTKLIRWGSWADRIFWPVLGLGLGIVGYILMGLVF